ncbi:site-2 protease family protein [Solirubrobacter sp. CPCC 204708]|uniref:Site-2 protease family protein n=1 Tax=Solirubrobacter deserti TaxID=2282478 RepID=A0ABT4RS25_9ACTN|nr:M50 family metallopeptidase [Solirubrobacter deserti]MBE2315119.1 site-2 protease family protein [Solirubrobacter deserti]MDA0141359.1 site-2 protease family protein [Solirubrobacter deserti]
MSWLLAFLGFAVLIILHEAGHFFAAKAVGMRVERFSLFFPPLLAKRKRGETEYAIGAIPLGGYVKITGMNPAEDIPPEHAHRAYYRQPVWKRIVVIGAGPAVNIVLAFVIMACVFMARGPVEPPLVVGTVAAGQPAAGKLEPGDKVLAVDDKRLTGPYQDQVRDVTNAVNSHANGGEVSFTIERDGRELTVTGNTFYDRELKRNRFGFGYDQEASRIDAGPVRASEEAVSEMWFVTSTTVSTIARIFDAQQREQIGSVVGGYETTRQTIEQQDLIVTLYVLALISLSLGVINLFPFLPLDGGHIFWALAEKVRGKAIPFSVMERAGFVGFALVLMLFVIGLSNDIDRIQNGGFGLR